MSGVALVILILGFISNVSGALECYFCSGINGCQTGFEDNKTECRTQTSPRCYVARTEVNGHVTNFSRGCYEATQCNFICQWASPGDVTTTMCQECCNTNLCNTGSARGAGTFMTPIIHLLVGGTVMALAMSTATSK
ncbi:ly6/PLAUR domain-containing protein 2-like [Ptychodera flava]|uniref:ly6/PLAUR domain-containing protein 2-like n=1 Tax=Ptychodera flava TaxID=63121 RepID=UPI00396A94C2